MKINYNELARYLIDKKIEIPLFNFFKEITEQDWDYYREFITDNWLNPENDLEGVSVKSIKSKIINNSNKLNNKSLTEQDLKRINNKFRSGNKLKNGTYKFNDLKIFLNFAEPIDILFTIAKKDLKKSFRILNSEKVKNAISYLNAKRIEQYHPESSDIYHQVPYNETDIRQILFHGKELFQNLNNTAISNTFDYYLTDLTEIIGEWQQSDDNKKISNVFSNLPKRNHSEWGFVGYEKEKNELIGKLTKGNRRLFQVIGQGGSGKSALVNEVCHNIYLTFNNELNFRQFIWISSKSDILENGTVKDLKNSTQYSSYKDLLIQLFLAINNEDISNYLDYNGYETKELENIVKENINGKDKIKRLIVIDNLENISSKNQEKIITFLEDNTDTPNYVIITSRHRIIQDFPSVNIELGGLDKKSANELFSNLIEYYQINFQKKSKADNDLINSFLKIANYYPLAIKYNIEKSKIDNISLINSFELCKKGGTELHKFIFHDTYQTLNNGEKRLLKTIVVFKTNWYQNIDKHVLRLIFNSIYKNDNFELNIKKLHEKTLISYVGLSDDDVEVVLTDLITSHVEDIFVKYESDNSKIFNAIRSFEEKQKELNIDTNTNNQLRTSVIQNSIFTKVLSSINDQLAIDSAISEIKRYSNTFNGLGYLEAKSLESNKEVKKDYTRKRINDYYLTSIRLNPQFALFWVDYFNFLKNNYNATINSKLTPKLPELYNLLFNAVKEENKLKFAQLILEVLSITKTRNENCGQFMEFVLQNKINIICEQDDITTIKYILTNWVRKVNKSRYIQQLFEIKTKNKKGDDIQTMFVKKDFAFYNKIMGSINAI